VVASRGVKVFKSFEGRMSMNFNLKAKFAVPAALFVALAGVPAFAGDHADVTMSADKAHAHAKDMHKGFEGLHATVKSLHTSLQNVCGAAKAAHEHTAIAVCESEMKGHTDAVAKHAKEQTLHEREGAHHSKMHGVKGHELPASHPSVK